jgi:hypothetical protein
MVEFDGLGGRLSFDLSDDGDISQDTETGNCFAPEAVCSNGRDVFKTGDFAGCVSLTEILSVIEGDPTSVISTLQRPLIASDGETAYGD